MLILVFSVATKFINELWILSCVLLFVYKRKIIGQNGERHFHITLPRTWKMDLLYKSPKDVEPRRLHMGICNTVKYTHMIRHKVVNEFI